MEAPSRLRRHLPFALAAVGLSAAAGAVSASGGSRASAQDAGVPSAPNVVVVMTDDQDVRSVRVMDHVKRDLANQGTTFDNFFATFPLCCPSRATYLSGQYAHNHGVEFERLISTSGFTQFDDRGTVAMSMRRAGYRTGYLGKYLNGYGAANPRYVPQGWDEWHAPVKSSATQMYDYTLNQNGDLRHYGKRKRNYQTDVYSRKAGRFVRSGAGTTPFFLTVATAAPHTEGDRRGSPNPRPAPRHRGAFDSLSYPKPTSFDEADVSDKPAFVRSQSRIDDDRKRSLTQRYRDRLASLLAVDDLVGDLVDALRGSGELANTYFLFTSDNGYLLGEHRLTKKRWLYEESAGVPLVVRGPGILPGTTRHQVTGNIDLAPTIIDVSAAQPLRVMDGRSLIPFAQDPSYRADREIVLENGPSVALRTPDFMYAEHPGGEQELYDLASDPNQLESRHGDPRYASAQQSLTERLRELENCAGDGCR